MKAVNKRFLCPEKKDGKQKPTRNQIDTFRKHFKINTLIVWYSY